MRDLGGFFKSIIEQDMAPIVVCDTEHIIVYMNPAAVENYSKRGGKELIGKCIFDCHNELSCRLIREAAVWFSASENNNILHTHFNQKLDKDVYMVALRDDDGELIGYYEKHECRTRDCSPFYNFSLK